MNAEPLTDAVLAELRAKVVLATTPCDCRFSCECGVLNADRQISDLLRNHAIALIDQAAEANRLRAELATLTPPQPTHEEGTGTGEIRWLWHEDYYDGPLNGVGLLNGEKVRIMLVHEQEHCCRQRTYAIDRMPSEWMEYVERLHADFREMVGTHTEYEYADGVRKRDLSKCDMRHWADFCDKYPRGSCDFNGPASERLGFFAETGWDRLARMEAENVKMAAEIAKLRELLTPLLGTEPCEACKGNGRVEMLEHCKSCNGTGRRNIADGLSAVECVRRLAKENRDYRDAASVEAFHGDEARSERNELREQVAKLREALKEQPCLCWKTPGYCVGNVMTDIPCSRCRALAATAPKEDRANG